MRLYFYVTLLTALSYPLFCHFFWSAEFAHDILGFWFGIVLSIGVGFCASAVLLAMQRLVSGVSSRFQPACIRLTGPIIVGVFSVAQMIVMIRIESGEYARLSLSAALFLFMPAFFATYLAYSVGGFLVKGLALAEKSQAQKRR